MSELKLEFLFKKIDREYDKEDVESFKIRYGKCLFCKKWCGIFHVKLKDGLELVFCPSCESIHKVLKFNKTHRIKTYYKGRNFEYQVKKLLEKQGFIVFRCASSKPLDLVAFRMGKVLVCECKTSLISEKDREKLGEWSVKLGFPVALFTKENGNVQCEVFEGQPKKNWRTTYELLDDFIQFLLDNYSKHFPNDDSWVNLSQLDSPQAIWKFLFEGDK
ncbi:MAG: hypothetical protein QHH15_01985 [Candidatus Thermoplasmatota archaeon]|jgi:Holliday junction resolvase|nr:hypothetical protein [Candidatus Thermoplasmatota archaeon]